MVKTDSTQYYVCCFGPFMCIFFYFNESVIQILKWLKYYDVLLPLQPSLTRAQSMSCHNLVDLHSDLSTDIKLINTDVEM